MTTFDEIVLQQPAQRASHIVNALLPRRNPFLRLGKSETTIRFGLLRCENMTVMLPRPEHLGRDGGI